MGLARGTVRRYAEAQSFPERPVQVPPPSLLDPYLDHLEARLAAGCENGMALWRELRELGFPGTSRQVHRWLSQRRTAPAKSTPYRWRCAPANAGSTRPSEAAAPLLAPKQLAWRLVQSPEALDGPQRATLARIAQDAEVSSLIPLARRFADLVRTCAMSCDNAPADPAAVFGSWLVDARSSGIRALQTWPLVCSRMKRPSRRRSLCPGATGKPKGRLTN